MTSVIRTALLGAALVAAPALAAQQQRLPRIHAVELTFAAGYFKPTGPAGQLGSVALIRKPAWEGGVHFGAYAKSGWWGAEVSAGYAPERVSLGGTGSRRTHLTFGTLRALVGRSTRKPGISVMAGAGLSIHHRQNDVTNSDSSSTHLGGAGSLLIRIPIDDQVGLRLDAQDLLYRADFGGGNKLRNDLVFSAGLGISW